MCPELRNRKILRRAEGKSTFRRRHFLIGDPLMNPASAPGRNPPSAFQDLDDWPREPSATAVFFSQLVRQAASSSVRFWRGLPRKARVALIGVLMLSCSFSLSMNVSVLTS
jgi:hypothetical protein